MIKDMLNKQKEVDELIAEKYDGDFKETLPKRIIAFKIEVSELANEIASFKYWKESHVLNKERVLDEASDCLAFIFSIILSYELEKEVNIEYSYNGKVGEINKNRIDSRVKWLLEKEITNDYVELESIITTIVDIIRDCGFDEVELFEQYFVKSKENIRRAKEGY